MNVNPDILEALRKEFGDEVYMKAKKQVEGEREWERRWMASMTADGG